MMTDRENALRQLSVGQIFHGRSANGASLVCLVTAVNDGMICARRIHTQDDLQFDPGTGFELGNIKNRIDCVAPLPPEIHGILVQMDRRYQAAHALIREGIEVNPSEARYTADERRAHDFLEEHIAANPI